jgi:hypothetical protein
VIGSKGATLLSSLDERIDAGGGLLWSKLKYKFRLGVGSGMAILKKIQYVFIIF